MPYFNVIGFLEDEELYKIWDICAEALERKGWDCDNAELSIRAYDDNLRQILTRTRYANPNPVELNTPIIMNGNMTDKLAQLCKHYKNVLKTDPELLSDLSDLGWDYTCGRMSRSGMEVYDKIMIKLGVLEPLEHWNEDCYQDHGCTH